MYTSTNATLPDGGKIAGEPEAPRNLVLTPPKFCQARRGTRFPQYSACQDLPCMTHPSPLRWLGGPTTDMLCGP